MGRHLLLLVVCVGMAAVTTAAAGKPEGPSGGKKGKCEGLAGAARGLCNAYCEAQECDVRERPACAQLRRNWAKHAGSSLFPCDRTATCGDGVVGPGEDCDPPGSFCRGGCGPDVCVDIACREDCTCPEPVCGDFVLDPGEECDDGNAEDGDGCSADCRLEVALCGGFTGIPCPPGFFCLFPPETCGCCDITGRCVELSDSCVCPDISAPVCGCDGRTYGNECEAACNGQSIAHRGECELSSTTTTTTTLPGPRCDLDLATGVCGGECPPGLDCLPPPPGSGIPLACLCRREGSPGRAFLRVQGSALE
jgi:cysteine-rich repeat protein